jgi:hypothetical protein
MCKKRHCKKQGLMIEVILSDKSSNYYQSPISYQLYTIFPILQCFWIPTAESPSLQRYNLGLHSRWSLRMSPSPNCPLIDIINKFNY